MNSVQKNKLFLIIGTLHFTKKNILYNGIKRSVLGFYPKIL